MREIIRLGPQCRERFIDQQAFPELLSEHIWLGGLSDLRGQHHIDRMFEGRMMVSYALEGGSYYRVREQSGHLQAGQVLFIPPQTPFTLDLDEGGMRRSAWMILQQAPAWRFLEALPFCFPWPDGPFFAQAMEALHAERFRPQSGPLRRLLVAQCREYLLRMPQQAGSQHGSDHRLDALLLDISSALDYPWTLDALCQRTHLSRAQLHRRFMAEYAASPMACINQLRLQRAAVLLEGTRESVARIGEAVGFANPFYFSSAFKAYYGVSPRAWRSRREQGEDEPARPAD